MGEASIPVDLLNPGQVFACLGFMEAAEVLLGEAEGGFAWEDGAPRFTLCAAGEEDPIRHVLAFLAGAEVVALVPAGSTFPEAKWKVRGETVEGDAFPVARPDSAATLPIVLRCDRGREIGVDYWSDATRRHAVKLWAGAQGKPGAAFFKDAIDLFADCVGQIAADPFAFASPQSGSFRFDWRRDYVPLEAGFSPNKHKSGLTMVGYPVVEALAAIGLTHARPEWIDQLHYRYGVLGGAPVGPLFHRAALGGPVSPVPGRPFRRFAMRLDWPGQEGQARCIIDVREESPDDPQD